MKKIITAVLALVMIVTCFAAMPTSAFANNTNQTAVPLTINQTSYVTFNYNDDNDVRDDEYWFSFVPATTDYYEFGIKNYYYEAIEDVNTSIAIYDASGQHINSEYNNTFTGKCSISQYLTAGLKYYVKIDCYGYWYGKDVAQWTFDLTPTIHQHSYTATQYSNYICYDCNECDYRYNVYTDGTIEYYYPSGTIISTPTVTPTPTPAPTPAPVCTHAQTNLNGYVGSTYFSTGFTGNVNCATCGALISTGNVTPKKKASLSSVKGAKKKLTVKWKKASGASGYQVKYSTKSNMKSSKTVTVKKGSTTSKSISKLKAKKKYYVQVRAYKTVNGKKVYSNWSGVKSAKTK